jgi:hypothetical protein
MTSDNVDVSKMLPPSVDNSELDTSRPKVVVFCVSGKSFTGRFLQQWSQLLLDCLIKNVRPVLCHNFDRNIFHSRNMCYSADVLTGSSDQKPFQGKLEYDYLIWLDPNVSFNFNDINKLMDSPYDITTGVYTYGFSNHQMTNVVLTLDHEFYQKNGTFQFMSYDGIVNVDKESNRYFEVEFSDMGLLCLKHGVAESIIYPWFEPYYRDDKTVAIFTDSYSYCDKLRQAGYKIMVDTNIKQKSSD